MNTRTKHSMFESPSQLMNHSPERIKPILDRLLVRDCGDAEKEGLIFLPHKADEDKPLLRQGIVVAVGPGDKFLECGLDGHGDPIRKFFGDCEDCGGTGIKGKAVCPWCRGDGQKRVGTECKVGDKILFDRRRECEVILNGEVFALIHEEQSCIAILED